MNKEKALTNTLVVIGLAMICCLLWGSAFPCIKLGCDWCAVGDDIPSKLLFAGMRFTISGVMAIIFCSLISRKLLYPKTPKTFARVGILSLFQTILQYFFFYIGLTNTTGVKASVIEGANVFVALIMTCLIFRMEKFDLAKLLGCLIGFGGVIIINLTENVDMSFTLMGEGFVLISTIAYACSSILLKRFSSHEDPLLLSGWQFLFGGIVLAVIGAAGGGKVDITASGAKGVLMLIYLGFISAAAYSLWSVLLKYNPVTKVAVFGFMNPVFGVILSAMLLDEGESAFSPRSLIALILVCIGIFIVNASRSDSKLTERNEQNVR